MSGRYLWDLGAEMVKKMSVNVNNCQPQTGLDGLMGFPSVIYEVPLPEHVTDIVKLCLSLTFPLKLKITSF